MKKTDLAKNLGLKLTGQMRGTAIPPRFGQAAAEPVDKREQRRRDAASGLVPFACKLPSDVVKQVNERAAVHEGGINGLLAELLTKALA